MARGALKHYIACTKKNFLAHFAFLQHSKHKTLSRRIRTKPSKSHRHIKPAVTTNSEKQELVPDGVLADAVIAAGTHAMS